tara:strand:+ start:117 stop:443 length:327 start_codon:yes stop_codon:yes gene_type:complete
MKKIIILIFPFFIYGCGLVEYNRIPNQEGFLYFSGEKKDVKIMLNDSEPFDIYDHFSNQEQKGQKPNNDKYYRVKPGKYKIVLLRKEELILEKNVIVFDQQVIEVKIP